MQLKWGDSIKQPQTIGGDIAGYFHHMLVLSTVIGGLSVSLLEIWSWQTSWLLTYKLAYSIIDQ